MDRLEPPRYSLREERDGMTVKFKIFTSRDEYIEHRSIEDDLYEDMIGIATRVVEGYFTVSTYPDGSPGEIFLDIGKEGHEAHGWADKWAYLFSRLLQTGIDPRQIYKVMKFQEFEPKGLTNLPQVPLCKSIPDLVVRYMEAMFPPIGKGSDEFDSVLDNIVDQ
jgi:hypothetical protein